MEINIKYDEITKEKTKEALKMMIFPIMFFIVGMSMVVGIDRPLYGVDWNTYHFNTMIIAIIFIISSILIYYLESIKYHLKKITGVE
jgi:hypothetical protein